MTEKQRLDQALVERGLCTGRDRAKGIIMAGQVYVNNQKADKPGMNVTPQDEIEVRGDQLAYVSRGGLKLEKAMKEFGLRLDGVHLRRYRGIHRRIYRLYAAKRRRKGLCHRCRLRPTGVEAALR